MRIFKIECDPPKYSEPGDYLLSVTVQALDMDQAIELALAYVPERLVWQHGVSYFRSQRRNWYIEELGGCSTPRVISDDWGD